MCIEVDIRVGECMGERHGALGEWHSPCPGGGAPGDHSTSDE